MAFKQEVEKLKKNGLMMKVIENTKIPEVSIVSIPRYAQFISGVLDNTERLRLAKLWFTQKNIRDGEVCYVRLYINNRYNFVLKKDDILYRLWRDGYLKIERDRTLGWLRNSKNHSYLTLNI